MIQHRICCIICCVGLLVYSVTSFAKPGVSLGAGTGTRHVKSYRIGVQYQFETPLYTANMSKLYAYTEFAFTGMNNNHVFSVPSNSHVSVESLSAVVRIKQKCGILFFFDIGFGGAYFSKSEIATRDLGSNLLFEDRFGLGVLLGKQEQFEIGYRFTHYSNAYFAEVNRSLNLHMLILGFWFY